MKLALRFLLVATLLAVPATAATFTINNVDAPGIGFNDNTPATPVGGNPGVTIGEQRLNAFQFAADLWGSILDSNVDIVIQGTFQPLGCSPTGGTLGAAGTIQIFTNFPGTQLPFHWYHSSLANRLAGFDLTPGPPDPGLLVPPFNDDIVAFFNGAIDTDPNCLTGLSWYYGFDNNGPAGTIDFLNVVIHEFAHGLGFSEFISEGTGDGIAGLPDVYSANMLDTDLGLTWNVMTPVERLASQVNTGNLVWIGSNVTAAAPSVLGPRPSLKVLVPPASAGSSEAQAASFGAPLTGGGGTTGKVVEVDDGVGVGTDACEPILNKLNGKIALIDRGGCAFTTKVANAEAAGAKGAIVANNQPVGPAPMGGSDPSITISSIGVTQAQGAALRADLAAGNVVVKLLLDDNFLAGANQDNFVRLYAPNPVEPGSSKSHFDTSAFPNLLMEPFISDDLEAATDVDLTPLLFLDIGWGLLP